MIWQNLFFVFDIMSDYKHPRIFADLLTLFKKCYGAHQGLPKILRIAIGEKILHEIVECMRVVVLANVKKATRDDLVFGLKKIRELRGRIEIIKAYFLVVWEMGHYSHIFFAELDDRITEISKQAAKWEAWMKMQK